KRRQFSPFTTWPLACLPCFTLGLFFTVETQPAPGRAPSRLANQRTDIPSALPRLVLAASAQWGRALGPAQFTGDSKGGELSLLDSLDPFGEPITLKSGQDVLARGAAPFQGDVITLLSFATGTAVFAELRWTEVVVHFRADDSRLKQVARGLTRVPRSRNGRISKHPFSQKPKCCSKDAASPAGAASPMGRAEKTLPPAAFFWHGNRATKAQYARDGEGWWSTPRSRGQRTGELLID